MSFCVLSRAGQKNPDVARFFSWCSIKNDYRTLVGLEDVDLLETYTAVGEEEDDVE